MHCQQQEQISYTIPCVLMYNSVYTITCFSYYWYLPFKTNCNTLSLLCNYDKFLFLIMVTFRAIYHLINLSRHSYICLVTIVCTTFPMMPFFAIGCVPLGMFAQYVTRCLGEIYKSDFSLQRRVSRKLFSNKSPFH